MKRIPRQLPAVLSPLIAAILASSGLVFAQEPLSIPLSPVTDSLIADENNAIESFAIQQDVEPVDATVIPDSPEAMSAGIPQNENELPLFNAQEMAEEDRDDLLRGPVHEAFAEQVNSDPSPNMNITKQPPEPVEELPPELKPDGRQVEWISGYWAWDEDHDDFIWVSGIWREIPQGFRWLPGYWTTIDGGFQWVSGTWVSAQTSEIEYQVEAPPETLELGPVGVAPSVDHIWIPGTWMWNNSRYAWRPGYWSIGYTNWVWVPARYQWTPRGYYHCQGYWDYPVNRRGVLFAPSYFNPRFRNTRITRFTPRIVVSTNLLTTHFWVRPQSRHYYFGNYYNVAYSNRGLMPWHQFPQQRRAFDPLYAYYSRGQRSNVYYNQLNIQFDSFVSQPNRRPPITFRDQDRWQQDGRGSVRQTDLLGRRFQNIIENSAHDHSGTQFVRMENRQREQVQQQSRLQRELGNQRRDVEQSLTQLQRRRDEHIDAHSDDKANGRGDLQDRLDRNNRSRVPNGDEPGSAPGNNAVRNGGNNAVRNSVTLDGNSKDSPTIGGDVATKTRDPKSRESKDRALKDGELKGKDAVADTLRLDPQADSKVDAVKDGLPRNQAENTTRDVSKNGRETPNGRDQKSQTAQEQSVRERSPDSEQGATVRQTERAESKLRLKLPPVSRPADTQPSTGISNSGQSAPINNLRRGITNRPESRSSSGGEAPNGSAIMNGPAIRNNNKGAAKTPAPGGTASNPSASKRDTTPKAERAPKPEPTPRSTPNSKPARSERSTPAPKPDRTPGTDQGTRSQSGREERPAPSITPPRSDSGGGARSTPKPATGPGRPGGGGAGGSNVGGGKAGGGGAGGGNGGEGKAGGGRAGGGKKGSGK